MGSAASQPAPVAFKTLTVRNLTITPLELKQVERLDARPSTGLGRPRSSSSSQPAAATHERQPQKEELLDMTITPFSECHTPVNNPDPARNEQIRLTFEDTATGHRYSAVIPGPSRRSIVLQAHRKGTEEETKEFTAIYHQHDSHLSLFSSANLATWMSTLDPSLPISSLSIPGTHNSPTCYVALPSVRCQVVPVLEQLDNGVRFLDVRVSCPPYAPSSDANNNGSKGPNSPVELSLVHSAFPIALSGRKYLSTLLARLYDFLSRHPSETVLLSLKREGTGRGSDADLSRILHEHYVRPNAARWYTSPRIPTLAQCRGRIVLVRRYGLDGAVPAGEGGIDGSVWPDNVADGMCGSGTIRIQDYYSIGKKTEIQQKVRFAQEGLERAAQGVHARRPAEVPEGGPAMPLFINFLSASNFFNASCWPDRIAQKINPSMIEYLCMSHGAPQKGPGQLDIGDAATGIVVTDWVGNHGDWDLVRCIVGWNARLQLRQ